MGRGIRSKASRQRRFVERLRISTRAYLIAALDLKIEGGTSYSQLPFTRKQTLKYLYRITKNIDPIGSDSDDADTEPESEARQ